jgi:8-oxo-dGTP pyrophosphatase MutT (NUDIX family)
VEPGSCGSARPREGYDDKARLRGRFHHLEEMDRYLDSVRSRGIEVYGAVLILLGGRPPQVLLERKSCAVEGPWSCDVSLPGGRIEPGESPVEAALREAWEEAWVHPRGVRVLGLLPPTRTRLGNIVIQRGDRLFWATNLSSR